MSMNEDMLKQLNNVYDEWSAEVDRDGGNDGWGEICGGITILENLLRNYTLDLTQHQTGRGTQLKNAGRALGNRVLERFGATERIRTGEFGRTSRGGPLAAKRLLGLLASLRLEDVSPSERNEALLYLQERMTRVLQALLKRETQTIEFNPQDTFQKNLKDWLASIPGAASGAVAQHLVGAKLQLRFPNIPINNEPSAAADVPTNRSGDIHVKDTVFHITMAPQDAVYEKCRVSLRQGHHVYLLVPDRKLKSAQQAAEKNGILDKVFVQSIESFVAQNIDEIAQFSKEEFGKQREALVHIYNQRIEEANERHAPFFSLKEEGVLEIENASFNENEENITYTHKSLFDLNQD